MRAAAVILAVVAAASASGCSSSPTAPAHAEEAPTKLTVAPTSATIRGGLGLRLYATITDGAGQTVPATGVSWRSMNAAVAAVDSKGLVSGLEEGETKIVAYWGDAKVEARITVAAPEPAGPQCSELAIGGSARLVPKGSGCA